MQLVAHLITSALAIHFAFGQPVTIDLDGKGKHKQEEEPSAAQIDNSVLKLNRHIFKGNVLQQDSYVKRWVVLYCLPWFAPCQAFQKAYNTVAKEEQQRRNTDIWFSNLRFAQVDCATDKVLCNDMDVDMVPLVTLYEEQHEAARFYWSDRTKNPNELLNSFLADALAKDEVRAGKFEPEFVWESDIAFECFRWFETMWLRRTWFVMDQDFRTLVGTLLVSLSIWVLMKVLVHRGPQEPRIQCSTEKYSAMIPHYYVFLSPGGELDAPAQITKQGNSIGSFALTEGLCRRTHTEEPIKVSGSILL